MVLSVGAKSRDPPRVFLARGLFSILSDTQRSPHASSSGTHTRAPFRPCFQSGRVRVQAHWPTSRVHQARRRGGRSAKRRDLAVRVYSHFLRERFCAAPPSPPGRLSSSSPSSSSPPCSTWALRKPAASRCSRERHPVTSTSASAVVAAAVAAAAAVRRPALTPGSLLTALSSAGPSWRAATLKHGRSLAPSHAYLDGIYIPGRQGALRVRCVVHDVMHHMARDDAPRLHALVRRRVVRQPQQRARRAHVVAALHLYHEKCACRHAHACTCTCTCTRRVATEASGPSHLPLAVEAELRAGHELVAEGRHAVDLGGCTGDDWWLCGAKALSRNEVCVVHTRSRPPCLCTEAAQTEPIWQACMGPGAQPSANGAGPGPPHGSAGTVEPMDRVSRSCTVCTELRDPPVGDGDVVSQHLCVYETRRIGDFGRAPRPHRILPLGLFYATRRNCACRMSGTA